MKKKYFLTGVLAVFMLSACHNHDHANEQEHNHGHGQEHNHEHDHAHPEKEAGHKESNENHTDEIILTAEKIKAAGIVTETVRPDSFRQVIKTGGQILAAQGEETTVVAGTSGVVKFTQSLTPGVQIGKGKTLFTLSADRIQEGDPVKRARIAYQNAKAEYERALPLAEKQIVTRKDMEALKAAYEDAKVAYEALAPQYTGKGVAVNAPIAGYVKNVTVKEGDYVTVGQPLMTLTQNRRVQLQADVSERYYGMLKQILSANFKTPYDDAVYSLDRMHGKILSYGKASDENNFYIPVTFEFDNTADIIPGSFVEVYLLSGFRNGVISLPVSALTEEQGLYFVYLQEDKEVFRKQEVKIGAEDGLRVEILSGLKPGDQVVTQGAYHVKLASASNAIPAHSHSH